ncbi:hypothetical protein [Streptomyces cinereoruber]|uniref:hypothetical protein n=1 Tax=Streptomyces cinereoruber TaxID=67260 RepID=UPI003661C30E
MTSVTDRLLRAWIEVGPVVRGAAAEESRGAVPAVEVGADELRVRSLLLRLEVSL